MKSIAKTNRQSKIASFLSDILRGAAIGIAFIIPGFSGGSVAAILGIYEKIVESVANIFKQFKQSFFTLLPYGLGMVLGAAALILPIQWGLRHYPVPTVTLFVGLSLGGLPTVKERAPGKPTKRNIIAFLLPCVLTAALAFLPAARHAEGFLYELDFGGYTLLFLVCATAACALVVPGISGSMLLLIFGYYNGLVQIITEFVLYGASPLVALPVILVAGLGMLIGFFAVSVLMKFMLKKFPRATYYAILGFIVGSIAAVYAPIAQTQAAMSPWYWVVSAVLLMAGIGLSLGFIMLAKRKGK